MERPSGYEYFSILEKYLKNDLSKIFNGELIYPRQIEIHLPADHKKSCNFFCPYCQGRILKKPVVPFESDALELVDKIAGRVLYYIYGGAYTEPLLNPYLMAFINMTKKHGSYFGIHTNGSVLKKLEETQGWITELCRLATNKKDYISISLDAGSAESHTISKGLKKNYFDDIIEGIKETVKVRGKSSSPSVRVCYLLNKFNSSKEEIKGIIKTMNRIGVDSLRFSIPYDLYGKDFNEVKLYKRNTEVKKHNEYIKIINPLVSKSLKDKPYIFYISPEYQDVEKMNFKNCIYSYYQITLAADGYIYKCSSTATPSFKMNRLGKITSNLEEFNKMVLMNHDKNFNSSTCFDVGARCNRMALEINQKWSTLND